MNSSGAARSQVYDVFKDRVIRLHHDALLRDGASETESVHLLNRVFGMLWTDERSEGQTLADQVEGVIAEYTRVTDDMFHPLGLSRLDAFLLWTNTFLASKRKKAEQRTFEDAFHASLHASCDAFRRDMLA
jgi:hypothetical protein